MIKLLKVQGKKILLRADASKKIGIGHVMRSYALAEAWQYMGGQAVFFYFELPRKLENLLKRENMKLIRFTNSLIGGKEDAQLTADLAHELGVSWVIADGYDFKAPYQKLLKKQGLNLLIVDDYGHSDFYAADIILNRGLDTQESLYANRKHYTKLLLGPKYISLRREFLRKQRWSKKIARQANKLLITMGGADPNQVTLQVVESLNNINCNLEIKVVVGPEYAFIDNLKAFESNSKVMIMQDVDDMAALMDWADVGITAGGGTLAEMTYMGLPNIIIKIADNQCASILYEKKFGTSLFLGDAQEITKEQISCCVELLCKNYLKRQEMSDNGRQLIDGKGSQRIFEFLV